MVKVDKKATTLFFEEKNRLCYRIQYPTNSEVIFKQFMH